MSVHQFQFLISCLVLSYDDTIDFLQDSGTRGGLLKCQVKLECEMKFAEGIAQIAWRAWKLINTSARRGEAMPCERISIGRVAAYAFVHETTNMPADVSIELNSSYYILGQSINDVLAVGDVGCIDDWKRNPLRIECVCWLDWVEEAGERPIVGGHKYPRTEQ